MHSSTADFRAAVRAGNFEAAVRALEQVRRQVELRWANAGAEERDSIATHTMELLEWARRVVLARRSHAQAQLARTVRRGAYLSPAPANLQIEFEG